MSLVSPAQAEEALTHLTHQFAPWRQRRTTPRGRIPKSLWAQAVTLAQVLPCTRVAKHWGVTPQALKRRREALGDTRVPTPPPSFPPLVEVAPTWRSPTVEVEVQRPDGTRWRSTYSEATPALVPLLQTFLEARCWCNSPPRVGSFWPCRRSTSAQALRGWPRSVGRR